MIMGLYLIKTEPRGKVKCSLSVDNQATLVAIKSEMNKSGQHLTANILQLAKQLLKRKGSSRFSLMFRWSAGHVGITSNKDADKQAKAVADGESSDKMTLPPCLHKKIGYSVSTIRQACNADLKHHWTMKWLKSPRYRHTRFRDLLTPHLQKFLKLISTEGLSRKAASTIFQLRVGHTPLNQYLFRFKKVDSSHCPACGHLEEMAEHFLLQCPKYDHERWPIINRSGGKPPRFTKILSSSKLLGPLVNYIEATGQFNLNPEPIPVRNTQMQ
jgi:hypothetical protein